VYPGNGQKSVVSADGAPADTRSLTVPLLSRFAASAPPVGAIPRADRRGLRQTALARENGLQVFQLALFERDAVHDDAPKRRSTKPGMISRKRSPIAAFISSSVGSRSSTVRPNPRARRRRLSVLPVANSYGEGIRKLRLRQFAMSDLLPGLHRTRQSISRTKAELAERNAKFKNKLDASRPGLMSEATLKAQHGAN
jgi:hypothetical protein